MRAQIPGAEVAYEEERSDGQPARRNCCTQRNAKAAVCFGRDENPQALVWSRPSPPACASNGFQLLPPSRLQEGTWQEVTAGVDSLLSV